MHEYPPPDYREASMSMLRILSLAILLGSASLAPAQDAVKLAE